jgi:hypothetical protein
VLSRVRASLAEHEHSARGVIGPCVDNPNSPAFDSAVHNFKTGRDALSRIENVLSGHCLPAQALLQDEGNFRFRARLDESVLGDIDSFANVHPVSQEPEVRLMHAKHLLYDSRSNADFLAYDLLAVGHPAP